jgi:hypothetical protein
MHGTPVRMTTPKPPAGGPSRSSAVKKGTLVASTLNQQPTNQMVDDKKKGAVDKEVPADLGELEKKLWVSTGLDPK